MAEKASALEKGEYIIGIAIILGALLVSATIYAGLGDLQTSISKIKLSPASSPQQQNTAPVQSKLQMVVINDKRCTDCQSELLMQQLKNLFPDAQVAQYDYSDSQGRAIYNNAGGSGKIPLVLFNDAVKNSTAYSQVASYLVNAGDYLSLQVGSQFDPNAEICGNSVDDDRNGKADCEDSACLNTISCMPKLDKPKVDVFVMSHCPYGTQMEKGVLPVIDLLGSKVDWNIRFVYYAMHGEKEIREQQLQYCMQIQNKSKYFEYLRCFLNSSSTDACLASTGLSRAQFQSCVDKADKDFNITANFNNQASWLSGQFPLFSVDAALNEKYNVAGSPTFVINGVVNDRQGRDPASVLATVCSGFKSAPAECSQQLSTQQYTAGFGFEFQESGAIASGSCG